MLLILLIDGLFFNAYLIDVSLATQIQASLHAYPATCLYARHARPCASFNTAVVIQRYLRPSTSTPWLQSPGCYRRQSPLPEMTMTLSRMPSKYSF
jgi:hypothetical protein